MAQVPSPHDTPMMRQYLEGKAAQPEALLLMRMGDFYEAFLEDAELLARHTGVALTSRNKDAPQPIAMAGIPHHQLAVYLPKLLALGLRVAVMDQLEDPKDTAKDGRTLVRRGLTRLITPGTLVDEETLQPGEANRLVALTALDCERQAIGIAALDVSTGRFTVEEAVTSSQLALALARLSPAELVVPDELRMSAAELLREACAPAAVPPISGLPAFAWKPADARRWLIERLRVTSLDGFDLGAGCEHLISAAAAALRYAEGAVRIAELNTQLNTQQTTGQSTGLGHVRSITRLRSAAGLVLDATCRRNLDLLRNGREGTRAGTLLAAVDRTRTAPGARLLAEWLARPLAEVAAIAKRHDALDCLVADDQLRADIRDALAQVYDLERLVARLATGRAHARDLVQLADSLVASAAVGATCAGRALPALLAESAVELNPAPELVTAIRATLVDEPPLTVQDGGLIRDGVDSELDELRAIRSDASAWLAAYQTREAQACGLPRLKVGYNSVFGYYLELPKVAAEKAPAHFIRKQTLVNAERYITPELKEYEDKALGAEDRIRSRETALFGALRLQAETLITPLQRAAAALAIFDVCAGLAEVARLGGWCRPVVDDSLSLHFVKARHPVVEAAIGRGNFVANDCELHAGPQAVPRLAVITGPNMAGKSTYIRQIAVLVILAQAGSFVPADAAHLGVVDRVFTRVGAGDELARGQSTFMVEMAETAAILHHATIRSLVILDEVGRGTSTFDGVSLAWAITEHLHDVLACRALFATHYHELTEIADNRAGVVNRTVAVAENADDVVFLHRIVAGAATKSYGIHVARIAGVPPAVISRARAVLAALERHGAQAPAAAALMSGALAAAVPVPVSAPTQLTLFGYVTHPVVERLQGLDLDGFTPRQAVALLNELQEAARRS
jgi:DNA mismatch repair protein MutS